MRVAARDGAEDAARAPDPSAMPGAARAGDPSGLDPMTAVKLWHNPCWFSFRINYLANLFNGPVYGAIEARYGLHRPDFVVIYSIGLGAGFAAKNIVASSGFPKNTISRSIQRLLRRRLIRRVADAHDGRSYALHLTPDGQRIFEAEMAPMLAHERALLAPLDEAERAQLSGLLARLVAAAPPRSDPRRSDPRRSLPTEKDTPIDA